MIRRPPRSTQSRSSAASDVYKRQVNGLSGLRINFNAAQVNALEAVCERVVQENGLVDGEAFVYLEVSRGAAPRTHNFPPASTPPTVFVLSLIHISEPTR